MLTDSAEEAPRVFVSFASHDGETANRTVVLLERAGLRTWVATRDIPSGHDHGEVVPDAIAGSSALLLLLSQASIASGWVVREVEQAITNGLPITPVALPSFRGVESLPTKWRFRLSSVQIRLDGDIAAAVSELSSTLAAPPAPTQGQLEMPREPAPRPARQAALARSASQRVATSSPRAFVGSERRDLLEWLSALWRDVTATGAPHVAVLLGETGFGKTRIVQEFYRRLADAQPAPAFWPRELVGAPRSGQQALRESRKRVSPADLDPDPGAEATFLWLGHVIDEGHGGRVDTGMPHLAAELGRALARACDAGPDTDAARMVASALHPAPQPGTDVNSGVAELLHRGNGGPDDSVSPGSVEAFWQGLNALWSQGGPMLPTVVVVEDGHFAGRETIHALELVATSRRLPFLIVVCAQESQLERSANGDASPRRPLGRLLDERLPGVSVRRLPKLSEAPVRALILEALPDLDEESCRAAVTKTDGNPYHVHTLLVEMVRAAARGRLDATWVRGRPGTFEEELRLQWRLLPDDVRRLLSGIAVLGTQVPERIGLHVLAAVSDAEAAGALDASIRTGWLRRLHDDDVLRFLERPRWVIANSESEEEWDPEDRRRIIAEALGTLESLAVDAPLHDPLLQELHLALALTADAEGVPFDRAAAVRSGLAGSLRLRLATDDGGTLAVAQDTERLVAGHDTEPGLTALSVDSALALRTGMSNALPQGGTATPTIEIAARAVERAGRVAERRPDLAARAYAALSRTHRVRFDETRLGQSLAALREAEAWLARTPAPDVTTSTEILHAQAMYAKAMGDNRGAAELGSRRRLLLERAFGPLDRRVTAALLTEGFYWTRIDIQRALTLKRDLLDRRRRAWGDQRTPPVALSEKELAFSLARCPEAPELDEAHALACRAVGTLSAALGTHHNSTALGRSVAVFTGCRLSDECESSGDADGARVLRLEARATASTNLDATAAHSRPSLVLIRRQRLGECLVRLGDDAGLEMLRDVLDRRTEASPDVDDLDIEVLWVAAELVAGLSRAGEPAEASAFATRYQLTRNERWPAFQPRGWASSRHQDARAGVL